LSRVLGNGHALVLRGARHSNVPGLPAHSDTLADHLRNAAGAAQIRSRQGHVECSRVADSLFALTQSQYFPGGSRNDGSLRGFHGKGRVSSALTPVCRKHVRAAELIQEEL